MAGFFKGLTDQYGQPIEKKLLTEEIAGPSITGVRSPITGYPADGLNPQRLASILREADRGDPLRYLELAETIEERDLHYVGVLGTRRRSVAQLDISVDAASDGSRDVEIADMVRDWLLRDELQDELFHILDAIGKGYSFTEIVWDTSEGQWQPERLEWRDPRWFRPARRDLTTPTMIGDNGQEVELPAFKFIRAEIKAKSGLSVRSGLARIASWAWMFKAFTQRDWAIFTQTYGQPIRIGKYGAGATKDDRDTLYRAVANIAADCAAIMPDSMSLEFAEAKNLGTGHSNYKERADWLDQQVSKGVLGQTATTDSLTGGLGSGKEHRQVQEDIETSDSKSLSAIINRDLIRPWVMLEYGPQKRYPRVRIARPESEDLVSFTSALTPFIDRGMRVQTSEIRDKFGLSDPAPDAEVLTAPRTAMPGGGLPPNQVSDQTPGPELPLPALQQQQTGQKRPEEIIAKAARHAADPAIGGMVERVRGIVSGAGSLEAAMTALERDLTADEDLTAAMRQAMLLAWLSGEAAELEKSESADG